MKKTADYFTHTLFQAFNAYLQAFKEITERTEKRFLQEDWTGIREDATARLELYTGRVDKTVSELEQELDGMDRPEILWQSVKKEFAKITENHDKEKPAKTFFNSVTRRIFNIIGVNQRIEFTLADFPVPETRQKPCPVCSAFYDMISLPNIRHDINEIITRIFSGFYKETVFADLRRDAGRVAEIIADHLEKRERLPQKIWIEVIDSVFYRYKGAYLIGRIMADGEIIPLITCLLNVNGGIFVDAVLLDEAAANILFSFTHSYFHVNIQNLDETVGFIKSIIPGKRVSEIYNSLGYHKHGKAELFRELMRSLENSDDEFGIARGQKGMVMFVFAIPSFNVVFKVIKDRFDYPKKTSADYIKNRYSLVFKHDRVGRLIDAHEFEYLELDQKRFSKELLHELMDKAKNKVILKDNRIIIRHLYMERCLTPMNIYIDENPREKVKNVFLDYGMAIKELAASNIFPGDLFFKNFGVTQYGRVVFYDYDELELLTECRFRKLPEPKTYEDTISDEPWFQVFGNDVFPEEFRKFLYLPDYVKDEFLALHGDLFDVNFWWKIQDRLRSQSVIHIFPYKKRYRLDDQVPQSSIFNIL